MIIMKIMRIFLDGTFVPGDYSTTVMFVKALKLDDDNENNFKKFRRKFLALGDYSTTVMFVRALRLDDNNQITENF